MLSMFNLALIELLDWIRLLMYVFVANKILFPHAIKTQKELYIISILIDWLVTLMLFFSS